MNTYIAELLKNNNRVIIPDFGAFIVKQGDIKGLTFNEFLKFNDGLLINYITEKEGIDKNEAKNRVDEFVSQINNTVSEGLAYQIAGLGYLKLDDNKKILFIENTETATETLLTVPKKETIRKKTIDQVLTGESLLEIKEETEYSDKLPLEDEPNKNLPPLPPMESKIKPSANVENERPLFQKQPEVKSGITSPDMEEKRQEAYKKWQESKMKKKKHETNQDQDNNKKKSSSFLWLIILLLVGGGAFAIWYFYFQKEITPIEIVNQKPVAVDSVGESRSGSEPFVQEPVYQQVEKVNLNDKFFIVAGCFQYEKNADRFVEILKKKGQYAKRSGKISGLHAVSLSSSNNFREAIKEMREFRTSGTPKAWVYVK